ncbi:MAG TPA: sigma-54 dependent transcriptional regulator [Candidatus Methylomirabilis sp.]|nr:sigma-54 dependent transcriptional regulator [Candidatus Methylomirabilis sp.]HSB80962.1 sigma-54 dependent transcriptional regulator [Candidatus Methylomirabilis sp.]
MANSGSSPMRASILIVDDDSGVRESFETILAKDYDLVFATQGPEALRILSTRDVNLILLDIRMPGMDGIEVLRRIKELNDQTDVVVVTAVKSLKTAVEAIKLGASDYVTKPFDVHEILALIKRVMEKQELLKEVMYLRSEVAWDRRFENLVGRNARMQEIYALITRIADNNATVILNGESGTGKEVLARAIHQQSNRAQRPFVAVNCAAIPSELLESELFGHEKGAFTGAIATKVGKFELATAGSLFLDEVGSMRLDLQAKILRALQEREIERVGGTRTIKIDVRVIAATNRDLKKAVEEGTFREDLYYRLNVIPITLPPLRQRRDDIPLLVEHFIAKYNREFNRKVKGFSAGATAALYQYEWPGNVRELENVIERAVALAQSESISLRELPLDISILSRDLIRDVQKDGLSLREARDHFERQYILNILEKVQWNQTEAARILGLHRNTLIWKIQRLGIDSRPQTVAP